MAASDSTADRFRERAAEFSSRAEAVPAGAWDNPSPCDGWTASDIVDHMVSWMPAFLASVGTDLGPVPPIGDDPSAAWTQLAAAIQAVLDDPVASAREFTHEHLGTQTVEQAIATIMIGDIVIHTWDLARATGGDEQLDPVTVHDMLGGIEAMGDALAQSGQYASAVPVADDADEQTRLLALTGRRV